MLELTKLASRYLEKYGREKVADITGLSASNVPTLVKLGKFPMAGLEKLLSFDPFPIHKLKPLYEVTPLDKKLVILCPRMGNPEGRSMDALMRLYNPSEMDQRSYTFNNVHVVRNALAAIFLAGPWEWSYWHDADSVPPCGDADTYYRASGLDPSQLPEIYASVHAIYRMLVHKKTIVSGTYFAKRKGGPAQFEGGDDPVVLQTLRRGPQDKLIERQWAGFGGILVHRRVFEDIIRTQGEELKHNSSYLKKRFGYDYSFFDPLNKTIVGDDLSFCHRSAKAAHKTHIDLAVQIAHVGSHAYTHLDA